MSDRNLSFFPQVMSFPCIMMAIFLCSTVAHGGVFDKIKSLLPGSSQDGSQKGTPTVTRGAIDGVYGLLAEADTLLKKSVDITFKMLANKDEIEQYERRMKEIESIKDPKEKEAETIKVEQNKMTIVAKATEQKDTADKVQNLDAEQKKHLVNSIYNIFLAGLKDKDALEKSKQLSQGIKSNPSLAVTFAGDATRLTDVVSNLPSQIDKIYNFGGNLSKLAQESKIEVALPKSSTESAKDAKLD